MRKATNFPSSSSAAATTISSPPAAALFRCFCCCWRDTVATAPRHSENVKGTAAAAKPSAGDSCGASVAKTRIRSAPVSPAPPAGAAPPAKGKEESAAGEGEGEGEEGEGGRSSGITAPRRRKRRPSTPTSSGAKSARIPSKKLKVPSDRRRERSAPITSAKSLAALSPAFRGAPSVPSLRVADEGEWA